MGEHRHGPLAHAGIESRLWRWEIYSSRLFLQGDFSFTRKLILKAKGLIHTSPAHRAGFCDAPISKGLKVRPKSFKHHPLLITPLSNG